MKGALPMEIMLVLGLVLFVTLLMALQLSGSAGNLASLATIHCNLIPQLCEKEAEEDTLAFESTQLLSCAIGAVGSGKIPEWCGEAGVEAGDACRDLICCNVPVPEGYYPQWMKNEQTCLKAPVPFDSSEKPYVVEEGKCSRSQDKLSSEACRQSVKEGAGGTNSPGFECEFDMKEQEPVYIAEGSGYDAEGICASVCEGEGSCIAELNPITDPIPHANIMEKGKVMQCSCDVKTGSGDTAQTETTTVEGLSLSSAAKQCMDIFRKEEYSGSNSYSLSCRVKEGPAPEGAAGVEGVLQSCACRFNLGNQLLQYEVFSDTKEKAWERCSRDFDLLKNEHGQDVSLLMDKDDFTGTCREAKGSFVLEKTEGYDFYSTTLSAQTCSVSKATVTGCRMSNFQLPQKVTAEEEWILYYGDPKYLTYWQIFPAEQDTWSFKPDLTTGIALGLVGSLPWGKVAFSVTKGVIAKGLIKAGERIATTTGRGLTQAEMDQFLKTGILPEAAPLLTKQAAQLSIRKAILEDLKKRYTTVPGLIKAAKRFGAVEAGVWAAAFLESRNNNFESIPNSVVLDIPHKPRLAHSLPDEMKGMPVLVDWDPGALTPERVSTLHFASPCRISGMDIEKKRAVCDEYYFNSLNGEASCSKGISLEGLRFWKNLPLISSFVGDYGLPMCRLDGYLGVDEPLLTSMETTKRISIENVLARLRGAYPENVLKMEELETTFDEKKFAEEGIFSANSKWIPLSIPKPKPDDYKGMKVKFLANGKEQIFADSDDDGFFDSFSLGACRADAVVVMMPTTGRDTFPQESGEHNYCLDRRGGTPERLAEYGGYAFGAIGVAAFVVTLPAHWEVSVPALVGTAAVGSAAGAVYSVYSDYKGHWPGNAG